MPSLLPTLFRLLLARLQVLPACLGAASYLHAMPFHLSMGWEGALDSNVLAWKSHVPSYRCACNIWAVSSLHRGGQDIVPLCSTLRGRMPFVATSRTRSLQPSSIAYQPSLDGSGSACLLPLTIFTRVSSLFRSWKHLSLPATLSTARVHILELFLAATVKHFAWRSISITYRHARGAWRLNDCRLVAPYLPVFHLAAISAAIY